MKTDRSGVIVRLNESTAENHHRNRYHKPLVEVGYSADPYVTCKDTRRSLNVEFSSPNFLLNVHVRMILQRELIKDFLVMKLIRPVACNFSKAKEGDRNDECLMRH